MEQLRIHLFGYARAFDGEQELPRLQPPKVFSLCAYLLLHRDRTIPRDEIAFALWCDESEADARANLRRHLHLLRRYLPSTPATRPWFFSEREGVQWNPNADYWLDVQVFEDGAAQSAEGESRRETIARLQAATDCYAGDLLENAYDDWVLEQRERLHRQCTQMLERLASLQESVGELRGAVVTAERLLAHDRLREENYRLAMRLCYQAGDRAAAMHHFDECRRLLREELDVEPMSDTLNLRDAIASGKTIGATRPTLQSAIAPPPETATLSPTPITVPASKRRSVSKRIAALAMVALFLIVALAAGFAVFNDLLLPQETLTLTGETVTQDTWITVERPDALFIPAYPDTWFKEYSQVHLQYYDSDLDRFLIRFDMNMLPANSKIERAVLRVHLETWTAEEGRHALQRAYPATVSAFRIRRPWELDSATYNTPWTKSGLAPGADHDAQPLASQPVSGTTWLALDVTAAARDWMVFPDANRGVMLKITDAPEGVAHYWVDTADHPSPARRPQLVITYRVKPGSRTSTQTLTLTDTEIADTWITSALPKATSASSLRGQSASELVWVTEAFKGLALPSGKNALDISFHEFPRARLNKAGQTLSHVLFLFDLARIPAHARIEQAILTIFLEPASVSLPQYPPMESHNFPATIAVHRLLRRWEPQTVTYGIPWKEAGLAPGADYDDKPIATRPIRGATWLTFEITAAVRAWRSEGNYGLMLTVQEASEGMAPFWMPTVEFPGTQFHPEVRILFVSE